jgi:hypothetical protein
MPENNQILSVEGQLVGMPLAGPESFSQAQLDYLKRALGVDEWTNVTSSVTKNTSVITSGVWFFYYNKTLKLISIIGEIRATAGGDAYTLPTKYQPLAHFVVNNPAGTSFIDYVVETGKFTARSGTNGYFSINCTLPCQGE